MSGGGIASNDQGSMWFAPDNGYVSQLNGVPFSGRQPPTSLEAAVHAHRCQRWLIERSRLLHAF